MIIVGDALTVLKNMGPATVNCCVTSPPYWGLRDYGVAGQLGLEKTPEEFISKMVEVFREVRRVLRDDGTLWMNLGDSYASNKQIVGIPWRVAFALQADGWYLRQDIIWHKPNPIPESVTDRCTKSHEHIFLLSKRETYYFDQAAIMEKAALADEVRFAGDENGMQSGKSHAGKGKSTRRFRKSDGGTVLRNKRDVWSVISQPFHGAHFATFPPKLIEPCILAGCPSGGTVLDPFFGAGTTGVVATSLGRNYIGIELNPAYAAMAKERIRNTQPGFDFGNTPCAE